FTAVYLYFYAKNNYTFFQMPYCIFIKNVVYYPLSTISENNHKRNRPLLPASSGPGGNLFQEDMNMKEKVVLAYSGGLDTTALIPWLKETFDYDVICCCVNCGQGNELDGLDERARMSGASKLYIEDIVDEFCDEFIMPCVEAGAVYEHQYLLG